MGASRSQIARLFLSETFLFVFIALCIACLLLLWLIPEFNGLDTIEKASKQISTNQLREPGTYLVFLIFFLIVTLIAGLYPSLYLSSLTKERLVPGTVKYDKVHRFLTSTVFQEFENRPQMNLWVLPVVLLFFIFLSFITISSQTSKAVLADPADILRVE
jgi:ABC-type lipoprotein release transport system permease subunit